LNGFDAVYTQGNVGIGTTGPAEKLEVAGGNIKIGTPGSGVIFPDGTKQTTASAIGGAGATKLQRGTTPFSAGAGNKTITFPTAFANTNYTIVVTINAPDGPGAIGALVEKAVGSCTYFTNSGTAGTLEWIAIGD
jgi:hypothetical protein